uniref:Secreted protein n=1 Tax=Ditylenchus dipsaci TaxID=166011 RepID=A0A915EAE3_9BILA
MSCIFNCLLLATVLVVLLSVETGATKKKDKGKDVQAAHGKQEKVLKGGKGGKGGKGKKEKTVKKHEDKTKGEKKPENMQRRMIKEVSRKKLKQKV